MVLPRYQDKVMSVKGIAEAEKILQDYVNGLDKITEKDFRDLGTKAVELANSRTPVDTGRLVSNNKVLKVDSKHLTVGNPTPYAKYVHDGTSRMRARPFWAQPIQIITEKFPELVVKDCSEFYDELVRRNKAT